MILSEKTKTFQVVAEEGSFAKAAEQLYISSTAVMKQINDLEYQLKVKLFVRSNKGLKLTEAGRSLYKDLGKISELCDKAVSKARAINSPDEIVLNIASSMLNPCKVFIDAWEKLSSRYPNYKIQMIPFSDKPKDILATIRQLGKRIDLIAGSRRSGVWYDNCSFARLGTYTVGCAVPSSHRLAECTILKTEDLHGETLMIGRHGDLENIYDIFTELAEKHPEINVIEADSYDIDTINYCAKNGIFLLTSGGWAGIHPAFTTIPLDWPYEIPFGLLYSKTPDEKLRKFLLILQDEGLLFKEEP